MLVETGIVDLRLLCTAHHGAAVGRALTRRLRIAECLRKRMQRPIVQPPRDSQVTHPKSQQTLSLSEYSLTKNDVSIDHESPAPDTFQSRLQPSSMKVRTTFSVTRDTELLYPLYDRAELQAIEEAEKTAPPFGVS